MSYPSDWNVWQTSHKQALVKRARFADVTAVNRFGARYRAAKAFLGADFDEYTGETAAGYVALLRLTLAYSAFEYFCNVVLKTSNTKLETAVSAHTPGIGAAARAALDHLRANDAATFVTTFFVAVRSVLHLLHRAHVTSYIAGKPYSAVRLAASIRHGFVHGHITPNIDQVPPSTVTETCEALATFLLAAMNAEFTERVRMASAP